MRYQPPFQWPPPQTPAPGTHNADGAAPYVNGDPAAGIEGSIPPAEAFEHVQREVVHVITESGQTPNHLDLTQLHQAIKKRIQTDAKLANDGTGIGLYRGQRNDTEKTHAIASLKAGSNITLDLIDDGPSGEKAVRITAAGSTGGGGSPTLSAGEGITLGAGTVVGLDVPSLSNQALLDDADLFAFFNQAISGQTAGHRNITWAQLLAKIKTEVSTHIVSNNVIAGSDVITDVWNATADGLGTLSVGTPILALPDVDLSRVAGVLTAMVTARFVATPNGSVIIEGSFDNWSTAIVLNTHNAATPNFYDGASSPGTVGASVNYSGRMFFEFRSHTSGARQVAYQTNSGPTPPAVALVTPATGTMIKLRVRYTGTGASIRVHGQRIISDFGRPSMISPSVGGDFNFNDTAQGADGSFG